MATFFFDSMSIIYNTFYMVILEYVNLTSRYNCLFLLKSFPRFTRL